MKELANVTARQLEVRLEKYTKEIKASYRQAHEAAVLTVKYALICGRNLNEAKRHCVHGSFERYVVETCGCHPVTARRYMRLAEHFPEVQERLGEEAVEQMTATDILEFIKKHVKKTPPKLPNRTEVFDLPADQDDADQDEPTDLTSEEHDVYDVAEEPDNKEHLGTQGRDRATPEEEGGASERSQQALSGGDWSGNDDPASGGGDCQPLRDTAYDLCLQGQQAIDALQRIIDKLNTAYPNTELYARICGREDENSRDLARWSRSAE